MTILAIISLLVLTGASPAAAPASILTAAPAAPFAAAPAAAPVGATAFYLSPEKSPATPSPPATILTAAPDAPFASAPAAAPVGATDFYFSPEKSPATASPPASILTAAPAVAPAAPFAAAPVGAPAFYFSPEKSPATASPPAATPVGATPIAVESPRSGPDIHPPDVPRTPRVVPPFAAPLVDLPLEFHRSDIRITIPLSSGVGHDLPAPDILLSDAPRIPPVVLPFAAPRVDLPLEFPRADTRITIPLSYGVGHDLPDLGVPLLIRHDTDRDRAVHYYYIWRTISLLLHCASVYFAFLHTIFAFRSRPIATTQAWLAVYMIYSVLIVFVYRFIFPFVEGARVEGALVLGVTELAVTRLFILYTGVASVFFHVANCLRAISFLCLIKTALGVDRASYLTSIGTSYGGIAMDPNAGIGYYWVLYFGVFLLSYYLLRTPDTRRPAALNRLHMFLSFFLGENNFEGGEDDDSTNEDSTGTM